MFPVLVSAQVIYGIFAANTSLTKLAALVPLNVIVYVLLNALLPGTVV